MIKMMLQKLEVEKEPGFSKADLPKVHEWIKAFLATAPKMRQSE